MIFAARLAHRLGALAAGVAPFRVGNNLAQYRDWLLDTVLGNRNAEERRICSQPGGYDSRPKQRRFLTEVLLDHCNVSLGQANTSANADQIDAEERTHVSDHLADGSCRPVDDRGRTWIIRRQVCKSHQHGDC